MSIVIRCPLNEDGTMKVMKILLLTLITSQVLASIEVKVRGYSFSPFLQFDSKGKPFGATIEIIEELNKLQKKYHFKFYKTSAKRRYTHFENKELDIIFFESQQWGWSKKQVEATKPFARGGEVFITKSSPDKSQSYFSSLKNKKIIGVLGFHYAFADYNSNENVLRRKYNMLLTSTPDSIISLILKDRGQIGVITESLLRKTINREKKLKDQILVSEVYDQEYKHTALVSSSSPIRLQELESYIALLKKTGSLQKILSKYGIKNF